MTKPHLTPATAKEFARLNTIIFDQRAMLVQRARCATCFQDKVPAVQYADGHWNHIYPDGSFLGPCFDPRMAAVLALTSK